MGMHKYLKKNRKFICRFLEIFQHMQYDAEIVIIDGNSNLYCYIALAKEYKEEFVEQQRRKLNGGYVGLVYKGKIQDINYLKFLELEDFQIDSIQALKDNILMIVVSERDYMRKDDIHDD